MNKVSVAKFITLPVIVGLVLSMGINGFYLIQGDAEVVSAYMNFYNRQPVTELPSYATCTLVVTGVLQLIAAFALVVSAVRREFMLEGKAPFLKWGILAGIVGLLLYGFATRMISNHQAAANLFFYTGLLYFFLWYVERATRGAEGLRLFGAVKVLPIIFMMGYTMGQPGFQKIFNTDAVMGGYVRMFDGSFLAALPGGIPPFIYLLGVLEIVVPVLLLVSVVRREFLPSSGGTMFFDLAMLVSITTFVMLSFGLGVLLNFPGATNLVFYALFTLGMYAYVQASRALAR